MSVSPKRPYLLRALYEWILENENTPYLMVDGMYPDAVVPEKYIDEDGKLVLDISPVAVRKFIVSNDAAEFDARFDARTLHVYIPIAAVEAIYAAEDGDGMIFDPTEYSNTPEVASADKDKKGVKRPRRKGKPNLKLVE